MKPSLPPPLFGLFRHAHQTFIIPVHHILTSFIINNCKSSSFGPTKEWMGWKLVKF